KLSDRFSLAPQIFRTFIKNASYAQRFGKFQAGIQRYCVAVIFIALCISKAVHLFAHRHSLLPSKFLLWVATFFIQDAIVVLIARLLARNYRQKWVQVATTLAAVAMRYDFSPIVPQNVMN